MRASWPVPVVLPIFNVSLHPTLAFINGLLMNPPQIILIQCHQFPAGTLIDTMGDIKACVGVDRKDLAERENLMPKRNKDICKTEGLKWMRRDGRQ